METKNIEVRFDGDQSETAVAFKAWKTKVGYKLFPGNAIFSYCTKEKDGEGGTEKSTVKMFKAVRHGTVRELARLKQGDVISAGDFILKMAVCEHTTVMKDMCADCGENLRTKDGLPGERVVNTKARVSMIHSIPELQVTLDEAKKLGTADEENILKNRKLVLLVDLDQTLIHTTNEDVDPNLKDIHHFQLYGPGSPWYHVRLRPNTRHFLQAMRPLYEMHICTFGVRMYAHKIAKILDADGSIFGHRILSRDECFNPMSKTANLKALFPCGDRLVCVIDDREDVWNFSSNVIRVKPYRYFRNTGDINAPPGFGKTESNTNSSATTVDPDITEVEILGSGDDDQSAKSADQSISADQSKTDDQSQSSADWSKSADRLISADSSKLASADYNQSADKPGPSTAAATISDDSIDLSSIYEYRGMKSRDQLGSRDLHDDEDDYLYYLEEILRKIHAVFYQLHDQMPESERPPDLHTVIPYVKLKVLKNVNLVFSGVIPTNESPSDSYVYNLAQNFGANIQDNIVPLHAPHSSSPVRSQATTHLIAARPGTQKVRQAQSAGGHVKIVTPKWLFCCAERWERVEERLFPLTPDSVYHQRNEYGVGPRPKQSADKNDPAGTSNMQINDNKTDNNGDKQQQQQQKQTSSKQADAYLPLKKRKFAAAFNNQDENFDQSQSTDPSSRDAIKDDVIEKDVDDDVTVESRSDGSDDEDDEEMAAALEKALDS